MANKIIPKKSSTASAVPTAGQLEIGEIAFNLADKKIYSKDAGGNVIEMGGGSGSGDVVGPTSATDNAIARFDTTTGKLIQNSGASVDDSGNLRVGDGSSSAPSLSFASDTDTGFYRSSTGRIYVTVNNELPANFSDAGDGVLNVGDHAARSDIRVSSITQHTPRLQVEGTGINTSVSIIRNSATNSLNSPYFVMGRSRGTADGQNTEVIDNDDLGRILFNGANGTAMILGAEILARVDGTPGASSMPTELSFRTTPQGSAVPEERLNISPRGACTLWLTDADVDTDYPLIVRRSTTGTPAAGIGAGIAFQVQTAVGNTENGALLDAVATDVAAGVEDFDLRLRLMFNGATVERVRFHSSGGVSIGNTTDPGIGSLNVNGSLTLGTALSVANGGTGGTTKTTAREGIGITVGTTAPGSPAVGDLWVDTN